MFLILHFIKLDEIKREIPLPIYIYISFFLDALGVPVEMQLRIYALYQSVSGKVRSPNGVQDSVSSTIGEKQRSPLFYIDEVSHYIKMLVYADDIVLI